MDKKTHVNADTDGTETTASFLASTCSLASVDPPSYTDANQNSQNGRAPNESTEVVPWDGGTYVILHRESGRAIAVNDDGALRLIAIGDLGMSEACHWKCVEKHGWFGFKHAGRYLGHDNNNFRADARFHPQHENFCVRRHPSGGCQLRNLHRWSFRNIGIGDDGQKLVMARDEGALWDFAMV